MGVVIVAANVASMLLWVTCYHAAKGASKLALYVVWSLMLLAAVIGLAIAANSIMNGSIGETLHRAWHSRFTDGILRTAQSAMSGVLNNNNPFANNNNNNQQLPAPNHSQGGPGPQGGGYR